MIETLQDGGMTTRSAFMSRLASIESSSHKSQFLGMFVHLSGQPFSVSPWTVDKMGFHCVPAAILVRQLLVKADIDMASTLRLSWICVDP